MTKLKNSNCDTTQKLLLWQNLKAQIVTKLKLCQNSNCDKSRVVTNLKLWHNSNCEKKNLKIISGTKHQLWQNARTQIMTKNKNSNYDKTQKLKLWQNLKYDQSKFMKKKKNFKMVFKVRTFWHRDNQWDVFWAAFCLNGSNFTFHLGVNQWVNQ